MSGFLHRTCNNINDKLFMTSFIDKEQKPCDDFHKFACGRFLKNISINDPYSMQSVKSLMEGSIQSDLNDVIIRPVNNNNALQKWWKSRGRTQRRTTYCFVCVIIGLVLLLVIYFLLLTRRPGTCSTPECHATASEVLSYIDEEQKPCDDFYKFACGSFLKNISINDPYSMQSVKSLMEESIQSDLNIMLEEPLDPDDLSSFNLAKKFYRACINENAIENEGLKEIQSIFRIMGGWPILEGEDWKSDRFDWKSAVRKLRAKGINFDYFFNVNVDIDRENPERYILGIHNKFSSPSEISPNSKVAFLDYMVDVASQFNVRSRNVRDEQNDVLEFLLNLAKISENSKNNTKTNFYNPYNLPELQHEFPSINWYEYLPGVLGSSAILKFDDTVSVSEPLYLKNLEMLLRQTNKRILANFMAWQTIQLLINYLPSKILDKAYEYLRKVNGQFFRKPRWSVCVEATRNRLNAAINLGYIERHFDAETISNVSDLIRNVKSQFKKNILSLNWLDEETKLKVIKALLSSVENTFSDMDLLELRDENYLYEDVEIKEDRLLKAVLDLDIILWDQHYSLLRKPVQDDWIKTQTFVSGLKVVYSANGNKLKFPLGLFRGIYFNNYRPSYMNYGLLGTVLAHQISHIFVEAKEINTGESKSAEEKLLSWWTTRSRRKYYEKLQCLSSQYAKFTLGELDNPIQADAFITRDEDIADLAGLKAAYDSYLEREWSNGAEPLLPGLKYSARQLFWISSALQFCSKYPVDFLRNKYSGQSYRHSPNEFRVNGPLQNLDEFSYDFGCSQGSYMNPNNKCYIW